MQQELSESTHDLIREIIAGLTPASTIHPEIAMAALIRAAQFFGELHKSSSGRLWDVLDFKGNFVLGKFTFSTAAGILPGTTLEQHGVLEHHARTILGVLDDQYVVDQLEQVLRGRPISLMGYVSGGTSTHGQIGLQLDPSLMYLPQPESDRLYEAVSRCASLLVRSGFDPHKPVAFHAEINNKYGFSRTRKEEYDLLKSVGVPEAELPQYRAQVYLTMPHLLPCNEDLLCQELVKYNLAHWARG
ncbi:MAG: hypothetical protein HXX20_09215 [Chloroflexi bacterium]|nr:hypothetical protein [Chloroflexota bacterium]